MDCCHNTGRKRCAYKFWRMVSLSDSAWPVTLSKNRQLGALSETDASFSFNGAAEGSTKGLCHPPATGSSVTLMGESACSSFRMSPCAALLQASVIWFGQL